ncbi:CDP-alcohol phosphatidyltransferase family protein [Massilicoli timonensis]|uniref:CDP-alcohol phosphatidyltransferase family protein n=1 Tax=Massilicoli timonensis TaxID=2015901 RepID=UPI000C84E2AD|nr:CDP-alcohol phosphatidyltransferase family protein [Massilicoli timonensis]
MEPELQKKTNEKKRIFTVPNMLSLFRLCLIPAIVWFYIVIQNSFATGCFLLLSGATDCLDGFIARRFSMISDLGKILDPVADKLTQAVMLICLLVRFRLMAFPLALLIIRDICIAVLCIALIRNTGIVPQAVWHGKIATALLYGTMVLHVFWGSIPPVVSTAFIAVCTLMIGVSLVLYLTKNIKLLRQKGKPSGKTK